MITDNTYIRFEAPPDEAVKPRFPRRDALAVARELVRELQPLCERLIVAGSLRRRKQAVGDVEILYVPKFVEGLKTDFFESRLVNCVDARLDCLLEHAGVITKRLNKDGNESWGEKNKYAVHVASGIPVDFFATTEGHWFNYLVCRTGSAETNTAIASAYQLRGCKWHPYRAGFTNREGAMVQNCSERDVFENAGLKYLEPWER